MTEGPDGVSGLDIVPQFPVLGIRLLDETGDSGSIDRLVALIESDIRITADVLRLSNCSALVSTRNRIGSVRQGVLFLGLDRVRQLAMTSVVADYTKRITQMNEMTLIWKHCLASAQLTRQLAERRLDAEILYTATLMKDLGMMALIAAYPAQYAGLLARQDLSIEELMAAERGIAGLDHCEAGDVLAERWNFPKAIQTVIAHHHTIQASTGYSALAAAHWCGRLAGALGYPDGSRPDPVESALQAMPRSVRIQHESIDSLTTILSERVGAFL